jgi:hypothetical protein
LVCRAAIRPARTCAAAARVGTAEALPRASTSTNAPPPTAAVTVRVPTRRPGPSRARPVRRATAATASPAQTSTNAPQTMAGAAPIRPSRAPTQRAAAPVTSVPPASRAMASAARMSTSAPPPMVDAVGWCSASIHSGREPVSPVPEATRETVSLARTLYVSSVVPAPRGTSLARPDRGLCDACRTSARLTTARAAPIRW